MRLTLPLLLTGLLAVGLAGCGDDDSPGSPSGNNSSSPSETQTDPLEKFDSDDSFDDFMAAIEDERSGGGGAGGNNQDSMNGDDFADDGAAPEQDAGASDDPDNEDITNTQEEGVDEGGIVKNIGDYLIVLRQGALYSVDVSESGDTHQVDGIEVAGEEALNQGVWYDEMLVRGNRIFVVGYRYGIQLEGSSSSPWGWFSGATEISSFSIDDDGGLERGDSHFFQSNDYFSGSNYASRLVDDELIFYMPWSLPWGFEGSPSEALPRVLHHQGDNQFVTGDPLFSATDIIQPVDTPWSPVFHTVTQCQLGDDLDIDCQARSLISDWSREFYVSTENIFLSVGDHVYSMPLQGDDAKVHSVVGQPIDQFSFRQVDDTLYLATTRSVTIDDDDDDDDDSDVGDDDVSNSSDGVVTDDEYWGGGGGATMERRLEMLALPLSEFDNQGEQSLEDKITLISDDVDSMWWMNNRHVDGWYIAGDGTDLYAYELDSGITHDFELDGDVTRIENAPGVGALVVQSDWDWDAGSDLIVDTLVLDGSSAEVVEGTVMEDMMEGESRSHGFFFRPDDKGGIFGLPILNLTSDYGWWGSGAANIGFFRTHLDGSIELQGIVSSTDEAGGECVTSCIDWYGNTRPIFLFGRIYALMGSEFVEVVLTESGADDVGDRVYLSMGDDQD